MTNNELRDGIAKALFVDSITTGRNETVSRKIVDEAGGIEEHRTKYRKEMAVNAFDYADAFMAERAKRGDWNKYPEIKQPGRDFIGAKS